MEGHSVFANSKVGVAPSDGNGSITSIEANYKIKLTKQDISILTNDMKIRFD